MTGFFMLSGYALRMVYGNYNLIEKQNLGRFYLKRILGIVPLYYVFALLSISIFVRGKESFVDNVLLFPIEALGLQTTFTSLFSFTHNSGTWFISCILLAYLIYPFLQTICKHLNEKHKVFLLSLFIFLDVWGAVITHKFHTAWIYDNPFYRIIEFACGLLVADINMGYDNQILKGLRSWKLLIVSVVVLIVGVSLMRHYLHYGDYMLYNVIVLPCFASMLFSFGTLRWPLLEKLTVIGYFSKLSYAFFLVQGFVWIMVRWTINIIGFNHNWNRIALSFIYCVLASIIAYELIQKPIIKFVRNKWNILAEPMC